MDGDNGEEEELVTRYRIQDMSMAKSLLDTYSMLRDHQARVAKWVKLWHHSFDILSKPRPCWTAEETAYITRMDNFSAVCHKSVLRSGTHLGATFDRAHEHTIEAAKKLAVPARDVDVQAKGLRRAAACIFDDCDSDEAQHNAAQACQVTLATRKRPKQAAAGGAECENPTYRSLAKDPDLPREDGKCKPKPKLGKPNPLLVLQRPIAKPASAVRVRMPLGPAARKPQASTERRINELEALDGMRILAKGAA